MSFLLSVFQAICHILLATLVALHPASAAKHGDADTASAETGGRVVLAAMRAPDTGYWHTNEAQILDSWNRPVRIQGINWYGFETERGIVGGLTVQDYRTVLETIKRDGYNTIRLPFSNQMVESPIVPRDIAFTNAGGPINEDLRGLNSLQVMDKVVDYAGAIGLKVILDDHRSEAGDSAEQSGLWYTPAYPETAWLADWQMLAQRYKGSSTVVGMDLRNEPHGADADGACWDCGGERDWHLAAERAGNAILKVNPKLIIFVEGTDSYHGDATWWGGNLEGVRTSPVELNVPDQLVYSPHLYGPKTYRQPWFNAQTTPASLESVWHNHWAYISEFGIAPVWLGEFGTTNQPGDLEGSDPGTEGQWFGSLVVYLGRNPDIGWAFWALNGEDENGLLDASYQFPVNGRKQQMMSSIMSGASVGAQEVAGVEPLR
ncbi:glycoside hydrolase family 5 protein [Edaphobacter sp.]|uniref:glycoside hydrolase family 5 protein n=1 Tax=Edaphobacter sp. TaxID=1934404 RepID=UPI002DBD913D|nr:glycoside hydrolase family 5 protein [Edaphobacter sp.]HEU5340041.1 glycoside hydrolase family 5 protein [Edaphobacter sp.]